ncbi:MAG: hypothetical protein JNN08_06050, partial [Bryobacterales bacterium]|nr:hypothetical protein [Bryobacterales bacterium]
IFAIFCFEMGLFLLLFPWFGHWEVIYFAWIAPESADALEFAQRWRGLWLSPYFRGAVSGLGLVNIIIALGEVFRLRRFSPADATSRDDPTLDDNQVSIK